MISHRPQLLALALAAALPTFALAEPADAGDHRPHRLDRTEVEADAPADPRFPQISKELEDGQVLAGKKTTDVNLAEQPAVANNELRQTFVRVPGLLVSEQQVPSHFNINYRGLGDPHESEFVMFFEDGVPLASSWFGYPTMYYLPPTERLERVQFVRGGSALLYGPQPGPAVNLVTRDPLPEAEFAASSRHIGGGDGLYATYNQISGGAGDFGYRVELDHREFDGTRVNSDSEVDGAAIALFWRESDLANWRLDLNHYESESGEAGRLPTPLFETQPELTTTPFNRIAIERQSLVLSTERALADSFTLDARLWHAELDRDSRRANAVFLPGQLPANLRSNFDHQDFTSTGLDARVTHDFGSNHTLTFGLTAYHEDSDRWQRSNIVLDADAGNVLRYAQLRGTDYAALFAESIFRFDRWSLIPALRLESLTLDIEETQRSATVVRDPIDDSFHHSVPLAGLGATYDFVDQGLQAYGNLSQGYRPMRYDDVGNPTSNLVGGNDPDPSKTFSAELGLRGAPVDGLFFDVSLFRIDFRNKIETLLVSPTEVERVNSGDARHQGIEFAGEYDFFAGSAGRHLTLFGSIALLDAEITDSLSADLVGNTPAYAPDHIAKLGLIWRGFDERVKLGLSGTRVDEQFWRDANTATGNVVTFVAAEIPAYHVLDLTGEWRINEHFRVLGGINNLTDEIYTSRVRSDGIEPAAGRQGYLGIEVAL
ncbi:MAG: TonB-dependent receptor [Xanthomonadales bacterium]|nr:TonB-dependent receptor [Xanthomonadales bacterium]